MTPAAGAAPVITIDGPTASGKGTVAAAVAGRLGFGLLDSGALYRMVALAALRSGTRLDDSGALAGLAGRLQARFDHGRCLIDGLDATEAIRDEAVGEAASRLSVFPEVRAALLAAQRAFRRPPGLVADGRDMGTVVFPDALVKVFLTASVEARAERRHKQLIEKGISAMLPDLLQRLRERDERDTHRPVAPLRPAQGALMLDSTELSIEETIERVVAEYRRVAESADFAGS